MNYLIALFSEGWNAPWFALVMAVSQILALLTIPSVLLQRQGRPRAALSWFLAMFAIPALGVLCWWFFGRMSMKRRRRKRAASTQAFLERHGPPHSEAGTAFDDVLPRLALGDSIFTSSGNSVELLIDGSAAFPAMEEAIRSAERTIHVMFYIFKDDDTGRRLRDLLAEKARAGVTVRVLVDAWGTPRFTGKFSDPLRAAGARVAAFRPSRFEPPFAPRLAFVNHRKLVVVDEAVAFTGGMNVADEYRSEWRDLMVRIHGPAVRALEHIFLDDWCFACDEDVGHGEEDVGDRPGGAACAVIVSGPDRESFIHDAYFTAFSRADQRVWIVTPYFVPSDALSTALRTAASRGVDVRVILPRASDVGVVMHAARSYYPHLLAAGVQIFEHTGPMLHAKAIVVDDTTSAVGSANVDTRSFRLSFEVSCIVSDRATNAQISRWIEELLRTSHRVTHTECVSRSVPEKLLESAANLLSPLL